MNARRGAGEVEVDVSRTSTTGCRVGREGGKPNRAAGRATVFGPAGSARAGCRAVNGVHPVPRVRTGARFERGLPAERPEAVAA
jgi:hypothetical protein